MKKTSRLLSLLLSTVLPGVLLLASGLLPTVRSVRGDETPAPAEPKPDEPKPDTPKPDAPKPDEPKPEEPKPDAPKPEEPKAGATTPVPTASQRWTLKLEHGPLRFVNCRGLGGQPACYEYMTLKVTNGTELPRPWNPFVEAITDTRKTVVAIGKTSALEEIRIQERDPSIQPVEASAGKIEPGETKNLVAIFGPLDPGWDKLEVRVHGLVNPIAIYKFETYGEGNEVIQDAAYWTRNQQVMKRVQDAAKEAGGAVPTPQIEYYEIRETRVWAITFQRVGDEFGRQADPVRMASENWKVIGELQKLRPIRR